MIIWIIITIILLGLVYWAFNFALLYHMSRFGIGTQPKRLAAVFLFGSMILFTLTIITFSTLNIRPLLAALPALIFSANDY